MKIKKLLHYLTFVLLFIIALASSAIADIKHPPRVVDNEHILSNSELTSLTNKLDKISTEYNIDVAVYTTQTFNGKTAMAFADDIYDYNGYGMGENDDGILLVLSVTQREYCISTFGKAINIFTNSRLNKIFDELDNYFGNGYWYKGLNAYADAAVYYIENPKNKFHFVRNLIISIVIGTIISFAVVSSMKNKLKTVKKQHTASLYIKKDSLEIRNSKDIFLYRNIVRTPRPKPSSSSGSSTHRSSSGRSHGGGGRKF